MARAVGLTPGALYRYFPSLDALVARVQARVVADLVAAVDVEVARVSEDRPLARILALGEGLVGFAEAWPGRYAMLARMLATPRPLVGDAAALEVLPLAIGGLERVRTELAAARARGDLLPGDDTERLLAIWAALHGATQLAKLSRFAPGLRGRSVARAALGAVLIGFGADRDAIARELAALGRQA